jgi:hypothetical protein
MISDQISRGSFTREGVRVKPEGEEGGGGGEKRINKKMESEIVNLKVKSYRSH